MNDLTVQQASQGLCMALLQLLPEQTKSNGVVIGCRIHSINYFLCSRYDGRHHSKEFADIAAHVFASKGIPVHLTSYLCPTPFVVATIFIFSFLRIFKAIWSFTPESSSWRNGYCFSQP